MVAKYKSKCEACLGTIAPGQAIRRSPGIHGTWEHADAGDCRDGRLDRERHHAEQAVSLGLLTREQAEQAFRVQTGQQQPAQFDCSGCGRVHGEPGCG